MDLVLGLSMTSTAVRWVLVEGTTGEGVPLDRGVRGGADITGLLDDIATPSRLHALGVTWTDEVHAAADQVLQTLADRGIRNVVAVSDLEAAEALARGIADIAGYDDVVVCIVEPDAAVVARVDGAGVTADRVDRPADRADALELTSGVMATLENDHPDAIFVVGSDDGLDVIVAALADAAPCPVITAAEADLALARGAALASARAVNLLDATAARRFAPVLSRTGVLTSVLAAAAVTFVVSLSVALGLRFTPERPAPQVDAAAELAPAPAPQPKPAPPPAPVPHAQTVAVEVPPAPAAVPEPVPEVVYEPAPQAPPEPVYQEPAAPAPVYQPPAPVYVPPPAPVYVPPPAPPPPVTYPQPRLRDRIIERIPIINRFHEPQYPYGQ